MKTKTIHLLKNSIALAICVLGFQTSSTASAWGVQGPPFFKPSPTPTPTPAPVALPAINSFTISAAYIYAGEADALDWSTSGATSISISSLGAEPASGSALVSPQTNTTYTLTASNSAGSVSKAVTVGVSISSTTGTCEFYRYEVDCTSDPYQCSTSSILINQPVSGADFNHLIIACVNYADMMNLGSGDDGEGESWSFYVGSYVNLNTPTGGYTVAAPHVQPWIEPPNSTVVWTTCAYGSVLNGATSARPGTTYAIYPNSETAVSACTAAASVGGATVYAETVTDADTKAVYYNYWSPSALQASATVKDTRTGISSSSSNNIEATGTLHLLELTSVSVGDTIQIELSSVNSTTATVGLYWSGCTSATYAAPTNGTYTFTVPACVKGGAGNANEAGTFMITVNGVGGQSVGFEAASTSQP